MKHNGKNIITDQDITLTGNDFAGKTLDSVLTEQGEKLDRIESNVKWIYKYGGVGSGSGGGSGSGSSTRWTAVVSRTDNGSVLKDGIAMNLSGPGSYGISIQIYRGGSDTFSVQYSYQSSKGNVSASDTLNTNNSFSASRFLNLDVNGTLTIKISNKSEPDEPPITYTIPYIVSSYSFNLYYVYADNHDPFTNHSDNTIFMNDIKGRGIMAALEYSIAVELQSASFTYTDWEGNTVVVDNEIVGKSSKIIYLPLCSNINDYLSNNDNAKFKQFLVNLDIILDGQTVKEDIPQLSLKDTLIPSDLFLRVTASGGTIYDSYQETVDPANQFIVGTIVFQVTPFYGPITLGRTYNFSVFLDGNKLGEEEGVRITSLSDQQMQSIPIPAPEAKEYEVTFVIEEPRSQKSYTVPYWFMTKEATSSFSYYPKRSSATGSSYIPVISSDVYRKLNIAQNIEGVTATTSLNITSVSDDTMDYRFLSQEQTSYETLDQMLCFGLQYVKTNDVTKPIARFNIKDGPVGDVYIYQNKIVINKDARVTDIRNISGDSCEIYFPMCDRLSDNLSDYHLLTIYKRLERRESNNYWKGIYVFIDGDLEAAFGTFTTSHNRYEGITLFPGNYYINLIENSCFSHVENDQYHYYMDDIDIKGYYYAYKELILGEPVSEETKQLYDNFSTFQADEDNYIMTNETAIYNIAEYSEIPTVIFNFTDNGQGANGIRQDYIGYIDVFKEFMSASYSENTDFQKVPITISYSPGKSKPEVIQKNGSPAVFSIEPQGSSTREYRSKNWEVYAPSASEEDYVCIYSPNFKESDPTTFLPEESFTFKSDVVDSSHTNNNAIASFVNEVTTAFSGAKTNQRSPQGGPSKYASYVKNCLSGFPVLVFLHTNFKDNADQVELNVHNYYFLGIYNLNLGRNSYFNLGYKNTGVLENIELQEGFGIYEIPRSSNTLLSGIMVGEVQGNNNYFDFSQYDQSILFKLGNQASDTKYMWGDLVGVQEAETKTSISNFVKKVSQAGGYIFDCIGKEYFDDDPDHGYKQGYSEVNHVPDYTWQAKRTLTETSMEYSYTQYPRASVNDLMDFLVTPEDDPEKHRGIDYQSLCEYYTICMAFGLVDSVEKNLNIKSWDAGREFYLAFYDMDTCLGVSNSGSKISYFAFSDYWDWKNSIEEGTLGKVKVYRDYAPKGEEGTVGTDSYFDTPSSYLFAIAKYAYQVLSRSMSSDQISSLVLHPNNLWARWRKRGGPLANSESFINKYYRHHLAGVPEVAFNYNYRYKYFVKSSDNHGFDSINFPKFYGRKIAYTETWLDNRLHILDAYFNINSIAEEMNGYSAPMVTIDSEVDRDNPDIYVFHDIFSSNSSGQQYANASAIINVKAKAYSPLICVTPNDSSRYMFSNDENRGYDFLFKTDGNQTYLFGGSALWTEVDSINPFIIYGTASSTSGFSITSDYFTKITGTAGTCTSWTFNTPSLKSLSLTNQTDPATYSGEIKFEGLENYPNLRDIRIDGTAIDLEVSNSNVVSISAQGMKAGAKLTVNNTPNIANISVSGQLGDLSLPCWGDDIRIPGDGSTINSSSITIQNLKYPGASIRISNASNLVRLVLTGFRKIVVDNCPKLSQIVLGDVEDIENFGLRVLDVSFPVLSEMSTITLSEKLTIGPAGTAENTVDLSMWGENFEALRLRHTPVEKVDVPDGCDINLFPYAFYDCPKIKWLNGNSTFWIHSDEDYTRDPGGVVSSNGAETFHNAVKFTMKQEDGSQVDLRVHKYCTNLENTFCVDYNRLGGHGDIRLPQAQYFLNEGSEDAYNVNSISYLFRGQHIEYEKEDLLREYNLGKCSIGFSKYPACNKFAYVYRDTWVRCYNRYMFAGLGTSANTSGLLGNGYSLSQVVYITQNPSQESKVVGDKLVTDYVLYTTTDFLEEIIEKTYQINMTEMSDAGNRLCFLDPSSGAILDTVRLKDIFCPHDKTPYRLGFIQNMEFFKGHILDMTGAFDWGTNIQLVLMRFMSNVDYQFFVDGSLERLFYNSNIYSIEYSLSNLYGYPSEVNIAEFVNWSKVGQVSKLFSSPSGTYSLGFNKKVSYRDFQDVIWYNILRTPPASIGSIFQDCTIYFESGQENEDFSLVSPNHQGDVNPNTSITDISFLFATLKAKVLGSTTYSPLKITSDFMKYLPEVKTAKAAFRGTIWANPIPWDFFNKRVPVTKSVYVKTASDTYISATFTGFEYKKDLQDITECFSNIKLPKNSAWKSSGEYNKRLETWSILGSDGLEYTTYYEAPGGEEIVDWPYLDSQEVVECALPPSEDWIPGQIGSIYWSNPEVDSDGKGLFVSPDIFSACATGCKVSGCFSASNYANDRKTPIFTGVIPEHLVWTLGKSSDLENIMANLNILPRLYGSYITVDGATQITNNCYYFVPSNFTKRTSLNSVFNFKMILPKENEKISATESKKDYYYILLNDSLPVDVSSMNSSFPTTSIAINQAWAWNGTEIMDEDLGMMVRQDGIYYSIVGTPMYQEEEFIGMSTGISLERYGALKLDGFIQPSIAAIISGRIFAEDLSAWTARNYLANVTNSAVYLSSAGLSYAAEIYLPVRNNQFLSSSSPCFINKDSIINYDQTELDGTKLRYYPNTQIIVTRS